MNSIISNKLSKVCLAALLGFMILASSCCKKDDVSNTLNGTTWTGTFNSSQEVFTFQQNAFIWMETTNGTTTSTTGTYTYNHPNVIFRTMMNGISGSFFGTISGNSMTITIVSLTFDLTKQ